MGYIVSIKTLKALTKELKQNDQKVVLTHGAFDLLHIGHIEFLKKSKKQGDVIIVGLESDSRIARYKSSTRPIIPLEQRLETISRLEFVDFVFPIEGRIFNNEYYLKMYDYLKPNIVTYGNNFSYESGMKLIKNTLKDIKIKQIKHQYDNIQSTTKIIDKIIENASIKE